jgi:phosphoribulokinase
MGDDETITEETIIDLDAEPPQVAAMGATGAGTTEVEDNVPEVESVLAEPEIEPQNEDALSRLVREAMQRAVESARSSES